MYQETVIIHKSSNNLLVAFHFHTSDTESEVIWVFYTQIMTSLLDYFNDKVIA